MTPFLFGTNDKMKALEQRVQFIMRSGLPVLIEGESGSGKEALAHYLHHLGGRPTEFVRVFCQSSEAQGTNGDHPFSRIARGVGGTLFLKNLHQLSSAAQGQLLSAIEQGLAARERGVGELPEVRLISSTSEPLETVVARQQFLAALYHRVSVYRIWLPPLRERKDDLPGLFEMMVRETGDGAGNILSPSTRLCQALAAYSWPGNLRELFNVAQMYRQAADAEEIIGELQLRSSSQHHTTDGGWPSLKEQVRGASRRLESEIILRTLEKHRWNRRRTAQTLKISYRSLLYKMKNCNLRLETEPSREGMD